MFAELLLELVFHMTMKQKPMREFTDLAVNVIFAVSVGARSDDNALQFKKKNPSEILIISLLAIIAIISNCKQI